MVLEKYEKIHVITRRQFEQDVRRHFVGEVVELNDYLVRVRGYSFVYDQAKGKYVKKAEFRIRVFSLVDASNIVNVIPSDTDLNSIHYSLDENKHLIVTDGKEFSLDINEFSYQR